MIRIFSLILLTLSLYGCATMPVKTNVNGTTQSFPMVINDNWNVSAATLDEELLTITLKRKNGEEYVSELDSESIEEIVCDKSSLYDCSSEDKIVESMIKKLAIDSIEMIEGSD